MPTFTSHCKWRNMAYAGVGVLVGVTCSDVHRCYYYGCSHSLWLYCYNFLKAAILSKRKTNNYNAFLHQREVYETYFGAPQSSLLAYSYSPKSLASTPSNFEQLHLPVHMNSNASTETDNSASKQNECTVLCLTCAEAQGTMHKAERQPIGTFSPQWEANEENDLH